MADDHDLDSKLCIPVYERQSSDPFTLDTAEAAIESDASVSEPESPEDDEDDFAMRAMAFARMRASSFGLGAAMTGFNNMLLSDDESEVSSDKINSVVSSLVSTISSGEYLHFGPVCGFYS